MPSTEQPRPEQPRPEQPRPEQPRPEQPRPERSSPGPDLSDRRGASPRSGAAALAAAALDGVLEASVVGSFSAFGHRARRRLWDWPPAPARSMEGRVVLVTGATSGIGHVVAGVLARAGATVLVSGRDPAKVAHVVAELDDSGGRGMGEVADLSSLEATRAMARRVAASHPRLDVVIHCAGGLHRERRQSEDGHELTVATHVLAPFLITTELADALAAAAPARVITVTSGGAYAKRLSLGDLADPPEPYRGAAVYAQAKRAQIALGAQWAAKLGSRGVAVHVMHPGWVDTPGLAAGMPTFHELMNPVLRRPEEGADTVVWLASAAPGLLGSGRLWLDRRARSPYHLPRTHESPAERAALWAWCERMTAPGHPEPG